MKKCIVCKKEIIKKSGLSYQQWDNRKFCSNICRGKNGMSEITKIKISMAKKGKEITQEHRKHLSDANKGKILPQETKRKISNSLLDAYIKNPNLKNEKRDIAIRLGIRPPSFLGKRHSIETRTKQRKYKIDNRDKNPFYKGGLTKINELIRKSFEYKQWREAVFTKDNYTDQKTGQKGGELHPHHIQNFAQYPEIRFDPNNGITLSKKTHLDFHSKYGRYNNTREQLEEFLAIEK